VAAAHAGWRGLAGGVLENTVAALAKAAGCAPNELAAWLGACIGPGAFEVGADVLDAFGVPPAADPAHRRSSRFGSSRFEYAPRADGSPRWRADLAGLAGDQLRAAGVGQVRVSGRCTVAEPSRFFSYRRDGRTGRMAACVWIDVERGG
jgi:polyphenol oxidase